MQENKTISLTEVKKILYENNKNLEEKVNEEFNNLKIGILLKEARKKQGLTLKEVAEKMQISVSSLSRLEQHPTNVKILTLIKYAKAIGKELELNLK